MSSFALVFARKSVCPLLIRSRVAQFAGILLNMQIPKRNENCISLCILTYLSKMTLQRNGAFSEFPCKGEEFNLLFR